jgi:hypothetical protein
VTERAVQSAVNGPVIGERRCSWIAVELRRSIELHRRILTDCLLTGVKRPEREVTTLLTVLRFVQSH